MKTKTFAALAVGVVVATSMTLVAIEDPEERDFYGWRASAGANFAFGMKSKLTMAGTRAIQALGFGKRSSSSSGEPKNLMPYAGGERIDYSSGAYIDPSSALDPSVGDTWNWRIPDSARSGDHFTLGTHTYSEIDGSFSESGSGMYSGSDDGFVPGVSLELTRELWRDVERGYGVDLSVGLAWYRRNNAFKSGGRVFTREVTETRVDHTATATYSPIWLSDPYAHADGGWWGSGAADHGTVMHFSDISVDQASYPSSFSSYETVDLYGKGDYEEWEISLMAKPWYELNENWRLTGTLGVGVSRSEFDFTMNAIAGGETVYAAKREFDDWDVYALLGLGTEVRMGRFDVSLDVLARCFQDDLEIRSSDVNGSVDKADWLVRLAVGCEF